MSALSQCRELQSSRNEIDYLTRGGHAAANNNGDDIDVDDVIVDDVIDGDSDTEIDDDDSDDDSKSTSSSSDGSTMSTETESLIDYNGILPAKFIDFLKL